MDVIIQKLKQQIIPHPHGFTISGKVSALYWAALAILVVGAWVLGQAVIAVLILAVGGCGYIMADVLRSAKNEPPEKTGRKIHTVVTCCFTGLVMVLCIIQLIQCVVAAL